MFIPIAFDLETYALPVSEEDIQNFKDRWHPPSNWKDEEKIAARFEKDLHKFTSERALCPGDNQVVAIGMADCNGDKVKAWAGSDEADILLEFIEALQSFGGVKTRLVGFNINNFDLPSLAFALYRNEIELPASVKQGKWDAIDLYKHPFWGNGGLKEYSRRLGNPRTDSGAEVAQMVEAKEWPQLKKYCAEDVVDTVKLYRCASTVFKF